MEGGAGDQDGGVVVPGGVSGGHADEELAVLVFEAPLVSRDADVAYLFDDTGPRPGRSCRWRRGRGLRGIGGAARSFEDLPFEE
jgi:hypothetical protein